MAGNPPLSNLLAGCTNDKAVNEKEKVELGLVVSRKRKSACPTKKLIVLDLNGLLVHRPLRCNKSEIPQNRRPDFVYTKRYVYKRPFLKEFMNFCLERFEVGIWSSAQERNIDDVLDSVFKGLRKRLLFVWDQNHCRDYGFKSLEKKSKPLFLKDLKELWQSLASISGEDRFSELNTLLIDDEPYKGLLNPPNTGIFPMKYDAGDLNDALLDPNRELCLFLKGLADAEDVPSYVEAQPFGQPAIGPSHPDWEFYSKVLHGHDSTRDPSTKASNGGGLVKKDASASPGVIC